MTIYRVVHASDYKSENFHVEHSGETLSVELTYPPMDSAPLPDGGCRYVYVNQENVRASDGVRLHYDYHRDGFVVEQPRPLPVDPYDCDIDTPEEEWIETGFFPSWALRDETADGRGER